MSGNSLMAAARPGDRVTILDRFGAKQSGRCVMKFPTHLVLNMGGKYGRPGLADDRNIVSVSSKLAPARCVGNGSLALAG